jgi:hypothetical protein
MTGLYRKATANFNKIDIAFLGSACVSHAGERVLAIANFLDG